MSIRGLDKMEKKVISDTDRKDVSSPESDVAKWRDGRYIGKERKVSDQKMVESV